MQCFLKTKDSQVSLSKNWRFNYQPLKTLKPFELTWPPRKLLSNSWMLLVRLQKTWEAFVFKNNCDCLFKWSHCKVFENSLNNNNILLKISFTCIIAQSYMCKLGRVNNWQRSAAFGLIYKQNEAFPLKQAILVISEPVHACRSGTFLISWTLFCSVKQSSVN